MLCFLGKAKGSMIHAPILIMNDGEITLTLGMDLGTIPQVLTHHQVNHLLRIY